MKPRRIFFAPLDWGLGHVTRILPLIRRFLKQGDQVYVATRGRALELLKQEAGQCVFLDFPQYPIKYPHSKYFVTRFLFITYPQMLLAMWREKQALKVLQRQYRFDIIISDNRFCINLPGVKSYLISHQLRYKLPRLISRFEMIPEYFNYLFFKKYDGIIIPDDDQRDNLTGELAHRMRFLPESKMFYTGILCDLPPPAIVPAHPIDYLILVSGPEPQRSLFENIIFRQVNRLEGRIVVALGRPEKKYSIRMGNARIYSYLNRQQIADYMRCADFIISRSGYTTIMEMVELKKNGVFVPTPGQIEQEFLARYYLQQGWCFSMPQHKFDLITAVQQGKKYPGFPHRLGSTALNIDRLFGTLLK
jgi:UDP:flavonoid glycosyltransferase YjiC (YdhE family)